MRIHERKPANEVMTDIAFFPIGAFVFPRVVFLNSEVLSLGGL